MSSAQATLPVRDMALALFAATMWGINNVIAKEVVTHVPPLLAVATRFALSGLLLAPMLRIARVQIKPVLICAVIAGPMHFGLLYSGFAAAEHIGPVSTVTQLWIPFATLFAIPLLGERPKLWTTLGMALAFLGVMIMSFDPALFRDVDGFLLVACASTCWAASTVVARRFGGVPPFALQAWLSMITWPVMLGASALFEHGQVAVVEAWGWQFWAFSLASAIMAGILGNGLIFWLVRKHAVALVAPFTLIAPIVTVILGVILLGEQLTARTILGTIVTLAGLLIITLRQRQRFLRTLEQPDAQRAREVA